MPIYMKFEGIDGSVTAKSHEKWIELSAFKQGIGRPLQSAGRNDRTGAINVSEVAITKEVDQTTSMLMTKALNGGPPAKVTIDFINIEGKPYLKYELTNCLISSQNVGTADSNKDGRPDETLSLNFTKIEITAYEMPKEGVKTGPPHKTSHDLTRRGG